MYCSNCGNKLPENSKFCNECGQEVINQTTRYENNRYYEDETVNNIAYSQTITVENKIVQQNVVDIEIPNAKKIAIWSIIVYAAIFYIISQFSSSIVVSLYVFVKDIPIQNDVNIVEYLMLYYPNDYYTILAICNLLSYLPILTILVLLSIRIFKHDIKKIQGRVGRFFALFGIGCAVLYGFSFATNIIVNILITIYTVMLEMFPGLKEALGAYSSTTAANQEALSSMANSGVFSLLVTFFITVIAAPVVEELIFRKSFFALSKKKGIACIIVSSLIFGGIHVFESILVQFIGIIQGDVGYNFSNIIVECINFISYVGSGVAFGIIYKKSNYNIWVTIAMHAAYNLLAFGALFIM